jgi:hypothetical protein
MRRRALSCGSASERASEFASERGVTLLELTIAMSMVAIISVGLLYATRTGFMAYEKTDQRIQSNRRQLSIDRIIHEQLASVIPMRSECSVTPAAGQTGGATSLSANFFTGNAGALRFVTSYSINQGARGLPQIVEWVVVPSPQGFALVSNEYPYLGPYSLQPFCAAGPVDPGRNGGISYRLAEGLLFCRLAFRKPDTLQLIQPDWVTEWTQLLLPSAIRVEMRPAIFDPARLTILSATIPIRLTRLPQGDYADNR